MNVLSASGFKSEEEKYHFLRIAEQWWYRFGLGAKCGVCILLTEPTDDLELLNLSN